MYIQRPCMGGEWQVITSLFMKIKMMLVQWPHVPSLGRFYLNPRSSSSKAGPGSFSLSATKRKKGSAIAEKSWENAKGSSGCGNRPGLLWGGHNQPGLYRRASPQESKPTSFMKEMPDLLNKLYSFYEFESCTQEKDRDVKELRKLCQEQMKASQEPAAAVNNVFLLGFLTIKRVDD